MFVFFPEASCGRNLDDLIESLGASDTPAVEASLVENQSSAETAEGSEKVYQKRLEAKDEAAKEGEEMKELIQEESEGEAEEDGNVEEEEEDGLKDSELMPSLEDSYKTNIEEVGAEQPASGLRRRNRPE